MAKNKQPVFEKPEEPDFIKRLKQGFTEVEEREERPLSEAPTREDELPIVVNAVNEDDLEKVRELHGLPPNEGEVDSSSKDKESANSRQNRIAGLGVVNSDQKKRKKLADLRAKHEAADVSSNLATEPVPTPIMKSSESSRPSPAKPLSGKRKKMKINVAYEDD